MIECHPIAFKFHGIHVSTVLKWVKTNNNNNVKTNFLNLLKTNFSTYEALEKTENVKKATRDIVQHVVAADSAR
jgi:hypothetical protein